MTEAKKRKKGKRAGRKRRERRFVPDSVTASRAVVAAGAVGAAALGAGVYGQWVRDSLSPGSGPMENAQWLVAAGAVVLAGALWFSDAGSHPVRVGDAGVAIEKGNEIVRVAWCDMERISVEGSDLVVKGDGLKLAIPMKALPKAASVILAECAKRVPDVLDVRPSLRDELPPVKDDEGEELRVEGVQVAGRHCAESDELIAFERDARLCPVCGETYQKNHVPAECVTCEAPLGNRALQV